MSLENNNIENVTSIKARKLIEKIFKEVDKFINEFSNNDNVVLFRGHSEKVEDGIKSTLRREQEDQINNNDMFGRCDNSDSNATNNAGSETGQPVVTNPTNYSIAMVENIYIDRAKYKMKNVINSNAKKIELLTDLRHFSAQLNMIDFSSDLMVALYFSCTNKIDSKGEEQDGEFVYIALPKCNEIIDDIDYKDQEYKPVINNSPNYIKPISSALANNRNNGQSSVFVFNNEGHIPIKQYESITIPAELKGKCREILNEQHNINNNTMFNDIPGFVLYDKKTTCQIESKIVNTIKNNQMYERNLFINGCRNIKNGNIAQAINDFCRINENNNIVESYINTGVCYVRLAEYNKALYNYNEAIKFTRRHETETSEAYLNRGFCKYGLACKPSDYIEAEQDMERFVKLELAKDNPNEKWLGEAHFVVGCCKNRRKNYLSAINSYNEAIYLKPIYFYWLNVRGNCKLENKEYRCAQKDFRLIIILINESKKSKQNQMWIAMANFGLGICAERLNDFVSSVKYYDKAVEYGLNSILVYYNCGLSKLKQKKHAKAIEDFDKYIDKASNNRYDKKSSTYAMAYYHRGLCKAYLENNKDAIRDFDVAISLGLEDYFKAAAYFNRGLCKEKLELFSSAIGDYDQAIDLEPDYAKAHLGRGICKLYLDSMISPKRDINIGLESDNDFFKFINKEINNVTTKIENSDNEMKNNQLQLMLDSLEKIKSDREIGD